jgi:hypothetical protein
VEKQEMTTMETNMKMREQYKTTSQEKNYM